MLSGFIFGITAISLFISTNGKADLGSTFVRIYHKTCTEWVLKKINKYFMIMTDEIRISKRKEVTGRC